MGSGVPQALAANRVPHPVFRERCVLVFSLLGSFFTEPSVNINPGASFFIPAKP
jgi:hypothetical protein